MKGCGQSELSSPDRSLSFTKDSFGANVRNVMRRVFAFTYACPIVDILHVQSVSNVLGLWTRLLLVRQQLWQADLAIVQVGCTVLDLVKACGLNIGCVLGSTASQMILELRALSESLLVLEEREWRVVRINQGPSLARARLVHIWQHVGFRLVKDCHK